MLVVVRAKTNIRQQRLGRGRERSGTYHNVPGYSRELQVVVVVAVVVVVIDVWFVSSLILEFADA
jgi:hypothetical protein